MFLRSLGLVLVLLLFAESSALAGGFRCPKNQRLIEQGATMSQVIGICGQPKSREDLISAACDEVDPNCYPYKIGELWIYDFGPYTLTLILTFYKNRLAKVEQGSYGE
jgi:hypothetical protein